VSSGTQVAVMPAAGRQRAGDRLQPRSEVQRPVFRLVAFAALALYGVLRWATLLQPAAGGRLAGLFVLTVAVAAAGMLLRDRAAVLVAVSSILAVLAMFALSGVPVSWVTHFRIAVTANAISDGLSSLPGALVPYLGINQEVRMVIVLGAGVLLLDAALLLAFSPRSISDVRRAAVAVPLVALAVVPSTLVRPSLPYLQGLVLFALLATFMWGERIRGHDAATAIALATLAGVAAVIAAPALDQHKPWLNYEALASNLAAQHVDTFDWSQNYGPLNWPRNGSEVLAVKAGRPDYWKAEDLDLFDGRGFSQGTLIAGQQIAQPDADAIAQWTQTLQVTLKGMRTSNVIAAGDAPQAPTDISEVVLPGSSSGTWTTGADLVPGDSYYVTTYSPRPSAAELTDAGSDYSQPGLEPDRIMLLPQTGTSSVQPEVLFPTFHSKLPVRSEVPIYSGRGAAVVRTSPYAPAFALAQRLADRAKTPYAFVLSVERYLGRGFTYSESPPTSRYPLETFLFKTKLGYCQQFAGAMALLLRMGGIPARVATGFTTGSYDTATHSYVVTDQDAHAWVEAWFPHYGWVRFDPTPVSAPARGGHTPIAPGGSTSGGGSTNSGLVRHELPSVASTSSRTRGNGSSALLFVLAGLILAAALVAGLVLWARHRRAAADADQLLAELERALARSGRPIEAGVTLAALERRFRTSPAASGYIRALRLARYGAGAARPTAGQRRALRTQLRAGLGLGGTLRAWWALPPRMRRAEND
jgi:transglutaminase-like putative cysteine protease